jgi:hydrogenase maturation protease
MKTLVIGYGNGLRGDDAVGPRAAEQVEGWDLPGVTSLAVHQLTPELAAAIAEAEAVWFIDACIEGPGRVEPVVPSEPDSRLDHLWSPGVLLYLAKSLYGAEPPAYHLLIPAVEFGYGVDLSAIARDGLADGLETLKGQLISGESNVNDVLGCVVATAQRTASNLGGASRRAMTHPTANPLSPGGQEALCTK